MVVFFQLLIGCLCFRVYDRGGHELNLLLHHPLTLLSPTVVHDTALMHHSGGRLSAIRTPAFLRLKR